MTTDKVSSVIFPKQLDSWGMEKPCEPMLVNPCEHRKVQDVPHNLETIVDCSVFLSCISTVFDVGSQGTHMDRIEHHISDELI